VIIEFLVDDVNRAYQNLTGFVEEFVNEPTTMPGDNRSLLFRDPDGNLVNLFTPVIPAAIENSPLAEDPTVQRCRAATTKAGIHTTP
jgi:hypothetical protein